MRPAELIPAALPGTRQRQQISPGHPITARCDGCSRPLTSTAGCTRYRGVLLHCPACTEATAEARKPKHDAHVRLFTALVLPLRQHVSLELHDAHAQAFVEWLRSLCCDTTKKKHDGHVKARQAWMRQWLKGYTTKRGEHALWAGDMDRDGRPRAGYFGEFSFNARRLVFSAMNGCNLHSSIDVISACEHEGCMRHLQTLTTQERFRTRAERLQRWLKGRLQLHYSEELHDAHVHARREWVDAYVAARTQENGDCLLWIKGTTNRGLPVATIGREPGVNVRRLWWACHHGSIPDGYSVAATCGSFRCFAHLKLLTRSEQNLLAVERGTYNNPQKIAASTRAARKRAKFSEEVIARVQELVQSGKSHREVAKEIGQGLRKDYVGELCRKSVETRLAPNASVFTWRPAA